MVKIFSGDDTDFKGDQRLALTFAAPDVDFTGCTAEIEFLGQRRTFAQVTNGGRLAFSFSADETRGMRCGVWPVTIRLRDASGRVRTVDNTQRIKVTNDVNEAYADTEQELSVALSSGGVAMPEIPASLDVDSADSVGQFKAKFNSHLELLRSVAAIAVAVLLPAAANAASVAKAPINNIPGTASVVTNVDLTLSATDVTATNSTGTGTVQSVIDQFKEDYLYNWQFHLEGYPSSEQNKQWDKYLYGAGRYFDWRVNDNYDVAFNWILANDVILKDWVLNGCHSLTNALSALKEKVDSAITPETIDSYLPDTSGFATKSAQTSISNIAVRAESKADAVVAYLQGDDVKEVVTNYDSAVHMPSRSLQQRVDDGGTNFWRVVWDEMTRWNWLTERYLPTNFYNKSEIDYLLDDKADRAWGFYDSHTGGWSPDGYLQISSPKILIAAGMAYQRHIVSEGAVWVLESNGLVTEVGGVASNGFFRITDDDKNALFEIVKGNKRTVGSTAAGFATTNIMGVTHCYIPYNVEAPEHPTIYATTALGTPFVSEESAGSLVNVTWTGTTGNYHAEVWPKTASSSLFIKAQHQVGGETYIKNTAPVDVSGGILCTDGIHRVRPVYNNGTVTWEVMQ